MSSYARTRIRTHRTSSVASEDEKRRLALTSPTRDQEAPAALNDPGYTFGQIAVQPAPAMEPQTKPRVSQPGDAHEQEADQVAEAVMRMPATETAPSGDTTAAHTTTSQSGAQEALPGSDGQPLDAATRAYMEPRFGHDFGHVRVHSDEQAAQAAADYHARAYTVGGDIVFGARSTRQGHEGQRLIAHELSHVVQQGSDATAAATVQREPEGATKRRQRLQRAFPKACRATWRTREGGAADLEDEALASQVMGFQQAILTGWQTALANFLVVLESKSDKESSPDFQKAMGKFFLEKAVGKIGSVAKWALGEVSEKATKPVEFGLDALKALNEEVKRAEEAKESATLRDFYVQHNTSIGKMRQAVEAGTPMIVARVGKIRDAMFRATDTKKGTATEALNDAADKYTTMRMVLSDAYAEVQARAQFSTPENIFRLLTEEWIRGNTVKEGWGTKEASVVIRMNKDFSIKDAHIQGRAARRSRSNWQRMPSRNMRAA